MNINYLLKGAKSEILADFICSNNKEVIITTNKAAVVSNLIIIKIYIKGVDNIKSENISSPHVKVVKDRLYFFIFYFWEQELGVSMTLHLTVTNCHTSITVTIILLHNHIIQKKTVENFGRITSYNMLYTWSFRID